MGKGKRLTQYQKEKITEAKKELIEKAKTNCKLLLDSPKTTGGSSDDGNTARRFFAAENRELVLSLFKGTVHEKAVISKLLQKFSIILRLISSKKKIDADLLLCETFPWISVSTSIHRLLGHSAERIRLNQGFGLGLVSEEGLEAIHKLVRRFRELGARKTSLEDNIQDVFTHLFIRSDPTIRSYNRLLTCSNCSELDHTRRSCPLLKSILVTSEEEEFASFINN